MPREIHLAERAEVPWLSVVLGFGPVVLIALGAATAWTAEGLVRSWIVSTTGIYAAAILAFLAGVRRGLSFRTEGGPAPAQIATMFGLFVLSLLALLGLASGIDLPAIGAVAIGFAAIMFLDPIAARHGQTPLFFMRLRPPQTAIAVASLVALFANVWLRG